jgi:hypothetical protein
MLKRKLITIIATSFTVLSLSACHQNKKQSFNQLEKIQIEKITKEYILQHPKLILDSIKSYGTKKVLDAVLKTIARNKPSTKKAHHTTLDQA